MKNIIIGSKEFVFVGYDEDLYMNIFDCDNERYYVKKLSIEKTKDELFCEYIAKESAKTLREYQQDIYISKLAIFDSRGELEIIELGQLRVQNLSEANFEVNKLDIEKWAHKTTNKKFLCLYKNNVFFAIKNL